MVVGVVHVRDALLTRARGGSRPAADLATAIPELSVTASLASAVDLLQQNRAQLGLVRRPTGEVAGLVSLDDLLIRLITDPPSAARQT